MDTCFSELVLDRLHVCALLICEPDYEAILKSIFENPPNQKRKHQIKWVFNPHIYNDYAKNNYVCKEFL